MMKTLKIGNKELIDAAFWIYIFTSVLSEHTAIGNVGLLFFCGSVVYTVLKKNSFSFGMYNALEVLFIIFCFFHIYFGYAVNTSVAKSRLITIIFFCIFDLCLLHYMIMYGDWKRVLKSYTEATFAAMLMLIAINFQSFISGRFSSASENIFFLGIKISGQNSVGLGYLSMIGLLFATVLYDSKKDRKKLFLYDAFFAMMILVSGTRKALLMIPLIILAERYFKEKSNKLLKFLKMAALFVFAIGIGYFAVMKIPALYNSVGNRVETMLIYFFRGDIVEGSLIARMRLVAKARVAFLERPWLGWGLDNFKWTLNNGGNYAHNNFYEILVSVGLIGFVVYYLKYVYLLISAFSCLKTADEKYAAIIKIFIFYIIAAIALEYWQISYYYRMIMIPFIIFYSIICIAKRESNKLSAKL